MSRLVTWQFFMEALNAHVHRRPLITTIHRDSIDQNLLLGYITEHRLESRLYATIRSYFLDSDVVIASLSAKVQSQAIHFLKTQKQLQQLVTLFQHHQIRFCILKGLPLSLLLYGQSSQRFSKDIDLWVSPSDLCRAHDALLSQGYLPASSRTPITAQLLPPSIKRVLTDFPYSKPDHIPIELHQYPILNPDIGYDWMDNLIEIRDGNFSYPFLDHDAQWVYLCTHGAKHNWFRLQWLTDIAILTTALPIDWHHVASIATTNHIRRPALEAQLLLKELFDITIPLPLTPTIGDRVSSLIRLCYFRIILKRSCQIPPIISRISILFSWTFYSRPSDIRDHFFRIFSWRFL